MYKFLSFLLVALVAVQGATAFTTGPNTSSRAASGTTQRTTPVVEMPSYNSASTQTSSTSTSLNLKVKIDPNAKTDNSKGNAKAAAYGGSIAIAALLPIAFLVWSFVTKAQ